MPAIKLHLFGKTKILIVEDNVALSRVLSDSLAGEGYAVLVAENGKIGYEMALAEHPDLILLDMMLPEMDGVSVLKQLRKDEWGGGARVLILSNLMQGASLAEELKEYKILGFIEKVELTLDNISKTVSEALKEK
jgi:DNA-binding response OmpR family regulator